MKHTKGPWINKGDSRYGHKGIGPEVVYVEECGLTDELRIKEADALLIVMAPELLEKLNMALGYIEALDSPNKEFTESLRQTIAKTEGESK